MKKWNEIKIVEELSQIHDFHGLRQFLAMRGQLLKKLALPAVVAFALIFFWISGDEEDELLITSQNPDAQSLSAEQEVSDLSDSEAQESQESLIYVDIGGEVVNPGVYQVSAGTRLFQVVERAGGLKDSADTDSINQAEAVVDGEKIIIGSKDETSPYYTGAAASLDGSADTSGTMGNSAGKSAVRETEEGTIVNINLADVNQLQLLPGVGPSTAQKIIDYRQQHGSFARIEDIMNISGIGEKTFENLKDFIEN